MRASLAVVLALLPAPALGQDLSFHGYLSERLEGTLVREDALMSTADLPMVRSLTEANLQARGRLLDDKLALAADVSALFSAGGVFLDRDLETGRLVGVDDHDVPVLRPRVVFSEAWIGLEPFEHLVITLGKKRVVWGSGQHRSPTDLLNPALDPTDPSLQRAGALVALVDIPFERFTLSGLFSPAVLYQQSGIPYRVLSYPDFAPAEAVAHPEVFPDPRDDQLHFAAALRAYALLFDTDVNVWLVYSNLYRDLFENKLRLAFSLSRNVLDMHEVHLEVLGKTGSSRLYPNEACSGSDEALARCALGGAPLLEASQLDSEDILPDILLGTRSFFDDGSVLTLEYLYQADGYSRDQLEDLLWLQDRLGHLARQGRAPRGALPGSDDELPLRLSFEPSRRHYAFASYMKPRIFDDWTVQGTVITALEDLSSIASAQASWAAQEWMTLSLFAFVPLPSLSRLSSYLDDDPLKGLEDDVDGDWHDVFPFAPRVAGRPFGEYDALPMDARILAEVRLYF